MPRCPNCGHEFNDHPSNMLESEEWFWEKAKSNTKILRYIVRYGPIVLGLVSIKYLVYLLGYISLSVDRQVQLPMLIVFIALYLWYVRKQYNEYKEKYEAVDLWELLIQ